MEAGVEAEAVASLATLLTVHAVQIPTSQQSLYSTHTHLKMCFLLAKWKHAVPTYILRGHRLRWGMIDPSSFAI